MVSSCGILNEMCIDVDKGLVEEREKGCGGGYMEIESIRGDIGQQQEQSLVGAIRIY